MTTTNHIEQGLGVKVVVGLLAVALTATFLTSFAYRIKNPSLVINTQAQPTAQEHGDQPEGGMGAVRELMMRMREDPENPVLLRALGEEFLRINSTPDAVEFLGRAAVADPGDYTVHALLGIAKFRLEAFAESAEHFEMAVSLNPEDHTSRLNLALLLKNYLDRPDEALPLLEEVVAAEGIEEDMRQAAESALADLKDGS